MSKVEKKTIVTEEIIGVRDEDNHLIKVCHDNTFVNDGITLDCEHHGYIAFDRKTARVLGELIIQKANQNGENTLREK